MAVTKKSDVKPTKMFKVLGPFKIKPKKTNSTRRIEKEQDVFWDSHPKANQIRGHVGCYVFGIQAAKGIRPVYVGKTLRSFEAEIFGYHQRDYYNAELAEIKKGTPVMFFVTYPKGKGAPDRKMIGDVEEFLIQVAVARNSNLRNVQNRGEKKWGIRGVIRSGQGKSARSSVSFKRTVGIHTK
jgi:hypothetical protein